MLVDSAPYQSLFQTLNFGSFPRNVSDFQNSEEYFRSFVFVDFELQQTLGLVSPRSLHTVEDANTQSKISSLIRYAQSINANNATTDKFYLEVYYASVVLAHLQVLNKEYEAAISTLNGFRIDASVFLSTPDEREFLDYISTRFHSILGKASRNGGGVWSTFVEFLKRYGHASKVSANIWIDSIFGNLITEITSDGKKPLTFCELKNQNFAKNTCGFVSFANFTLRAENKKYLASSFRQEYVAYVSDILEAKIRQKTNFPDASDENSEDLDFVQSFYQSLKSVSSHRPVMTYLAKPKLSKKFLVSMSEKSYQSQTVLYNLVMTLIDLGEYDEALAAFKTYVSYVERDTVQTGTVLDILQVISLYSFCILLFNPSSSFIPDAKTSSKKFRYNTLDTVIQELIKFSEDLKEYADRAAHIAELSYDDDLNGEERDLLSFLYRRYNPNCLLNTESALISTLSEAWYNLAKLYQYLSHHGSANFKILRGNLDKVLLYYKNSLILDSTGNLHYLFDYALTLAHEHQVTEASKLCKFILKKFPDSFKTWNLLVLLASAANTREAANDVEASSSQASERRSKDSSDGGPDVANQNGKSFKGDSPEKFIEDALNIASIYVSKRHDARTTVSVKAKYEILQLKMTQLAVWEAEYGVEATLESIADVFVLYRELFHLTNLLKEETQDIAGAKSDAKWSNRPSVMDPNKANAHGDVEQTKALRHLTTEKIKRLSRLSLESADRKLDASMREDRENTRDSKKELRILQDIWLWAASIYLRLGFLEETEQCIVEAETADKPNVKTYTYLGLLTSKSRKNLALQEFERSFEVLHSAEEKFNKKTYGLTLLGMSQLLTTKNEENSSLFVSEKDRDAGLVRIKNYLEGYSNCWPYGLNSPEVWYYLSAIYEEFDDKILQSEALWKCVDLETIRPVRSYDVCEDFTL